MKNIFSAAALSIAIIAASCSGATAHSTGESPKETPAKKMAPSSPGKMKEFMAMLDGTEGSSQKAADAYFSDDLKKSQAEDDNLTFNNFILSEAKVVASNLPCCTMEAKAGVTTRRFELCWEGDKVTSIKDLGIK